MKHCFKN